MLKLKKINNLYKLVEITQLKNNKKKFVKKKLLLIEITKVIAI